jgi:predicted ester cyclase
MTVGVDVSGQAATPNFKKPSSSLSGGGSHARQHSDQTTGSASMKPSTQSASAQSYVERLAPSQQFVTELAINEANLAVIHGHRSATNAQGVAVSWRETHICQLAEDIVTQHWSHTPNERAEALLAGKRPPLTPIPVSGKARFIAQAVGVLARVTRPANIHSNLPAEGNRELVRRYIEEFKNQQKFQVFPRYFSHRFRHHFDFDGQPDTASSFVNVGVNLLDGFPDVHVELLHLIADDDLVVEHNTVTATHTGTWAGQHATGRAVTWSEAHIYRVKDRRIVENWPAVNFDNLLLQIQ